MRYLLMTLIFTSNFAFADCASSGIYVFPTENEIHENSMFTLEGYYFSQEVIRDLDSNYTAYLVSKNDKIPLKILDRYVGMMDLYKVRLKPAEYLEMNTEYSLKIYDDDNKLVDVLTNRYNPKTKKNEDIKWTVTKKADKKVPVWGPSIKHKENSMTFFGCGPANYSIFEAEIIDASDVLVYTEIRNTKTEEINSYLIPFEEGGFISMGHGMCAGAFKFKSGVKYEARFKPVDACGNFGAGTLWYSFDNPVDIYSSN